jgi:hypothetical protein
MTLQSMAQQAERYPAMGCNPVGHLRARDGGLAA